MYLSPLLVQPGLANRQDERREETNEMKNENLKTGATETINLSLARYKLCEHMKFICGISAEIRLSITMY